MTGCKTFSVVELVGDGTGIVTPEEIGAGDIAVSVARPFGEPNEQGQRPIERVWLSESQFASHLGVSEPDEELVDEYDAVVTLSNVPLPDAYIGIGANELRIEVTVSQVEEAKARGCPRCQEDMAETFSDGGCTNCGFYFDGDHLSAERRAELNAIHDDYLSQEE